MAIGAVGGIIFSIYSGKEADKHYEKSDKIITNQNDLKNGQEDLKEKSDEILNYQKEKVLSDLGVSIKNCYYSENYIELKSKRFPKLKKLTFPIIKIILTNSGTNPIKDIKIFFDYFFPLSKQYTIDFYNNSNKLSAGQSIIYSSIPPMDSKDLKLFRLKMRVEWVDFQTQSKYEYIYYFELSNHSGKLLYSPLDWTLDNHKEIIFDSKDYDLIAPKDFKFHKSSFIEDNFK